MIFLLYEPFTATQSHELGLPVLVYAEEIPLFVFIGRISV